MSAEAQAPAQPVELREVRGPSATGGGSRRFFELLWLISATEFKKSFHGTAFGYIWSLVRPLMLFGVLLVVFTRILKFEVPNYPVMLLFNLVVFGFFQEGTGAAVTSVLAQEGIVRKTQFPRLVIPLSSVMVALFTVALNLVAVFGFIFIYGIDPMWTWLFLPVIILLVFALTAGASLLLSALNVRFRDIAIIWTVVAQVLLYATPIIYPFEIIYPGLLRDVLLCNPFTLIFEQARVWIIDPAAPSALDIAGSWVAMLPAAAIYVLTCILGVWVFKREAPKIAERL
ncbi:MAG TPA: ABC transporter permease [Solirubrobacterales bacterium]|jgi:ABC-2 type transport system permease protein|nr:ABC transporter permease [Solirubrobacterales bacterium]